MRKFSQDLIHLKKSDDLPIHLQIYTRFKEAVEGDLLKDGDRVPSTRILASELNVARGTVESAYSMLLGEGILISKGQAGTYVSRHTGAVDGTKMLRTVAVEVGKIQVSERPARRSVMVSPVFLPGCPAFDAFPRKMWARLCGNNIRRLSLEQMQLKEPQGYEPLRKSIATYLRIARGVMCEPEQVFITHGYQGALDFLCKVLQLRGQDVWLEDPGYFYATKIFEEIGARIISVPVDDEGMKIDSGLCQSPKARVAVVTPSHHSPLGMPLSASRRSQILEWASKNDSWIIEDDYDGEFRYSGYPLPSLKSLDQYERVIYAGSFSKTIYPALKIGYIVVPQRLIDNCLEKAYIYQRGFDAVPQMTINDFIAEGHFSKHLKKMRDLYAHRRQLTIEALMESLDGKIRISSHKNGMNFVAALDVMQSDTTICAAFNAQGFGIRPLSSSTSNQSLNGLIIGFTNVSSKKVALDAAFKLRSSFDGASV